VRIACAWFLAIGLLLGPAVGAVAEAVVERSVAFTDQINAVAVDHDGRIWMGTPGGVLRWDSANASDSLLHWTAADGLPDNWVSDIVVAPEGAVWVSMATWLGGVSTFANGRWITFDERNGLASDFVRNLAVDQDGNIWAATARGLSVLSPSADPEAGGIKATITTLIWDGDPAVGRPAGVAVDARGRVWVWQGSGNIVVLDPSGTPHDPSDDVWTVHPAERIAAATPIERVIPDPWGAVWIVHRSQGLVALDDGGTPDPGDDRSLEYLPGESLPLDATGFITFDDSGDLWLATSRGELYVLSGAETPFELCDDAWDLVASGLGEPSWTPGGVVAAAEDELWLIDGNREGAIRLRHQGTLEDGTDDRWERFLARSDLPSQDVRGFAFFEDQVWVASDGGVVVRTEEGWQQALSASVYDITADGPVIWAGTWGGLFAIELREDGVVSTNYRAEQGLADNYVQSVAVDRLGRVWCGVPEAGVCVLDLGGTPHDPSDDCWILLTHEALLEGQGVVAIGFQGAARVWFATGDAGAVALDFGGSLEDPLDDVWVRYNASTGMPSGGVYSVLVEGDRSVWLGGCSDIVAVDPGEIFADLGDDRMTVIRQSNCMPALTQDQDGVLWFPNGWNGIRRYDTRGTPHDLEDDVCDVIRIVDGLLDDRTNAVAIGPDGRIWVGTDAGFTVLRWQ